MIPQSFNHLVHPSIATNVTFYIFLKNFGRATDTSVGLLVKSPLGLKARRDSLFRTWRRRTYYTFVEIQIWCNTC